jgi:ABC-type nickel/cobalt efflux system permease component RcnA
MDSSVGVILASGFIWGLHHALDPDHLVAVSTIVSEHKSVSRSSLVGTFWGIGHTSSLLIISLIVLLLRSSIPNNIARWMEAPVAIMLVVLGIITIIKAIRERGLRIHSHTHAHDESSPHTHLHIHLDKEHVHQHRLFKLGKRPFMVGMVHGVAGSAALTLLVLSTIPSVALGLIYIGVFGVGSIGGMLLMSTLIGVPFALTARRYTVINGGIRFAAGAFSIVYGLVLAWKL